MRAVLFLAAFLAAGAVGAQVYKCPQPDGKVTYSDRPCPSGAKGTTVKVDANTVSAIDQAEAKKKREEVDKRLAARAQADADAKAARAKAIQERIDECQGFLDEINRQRAWLSAESATVRQSAVNEINIQRRKLVERECDRYL